MVQRLARPAYKEKVLVEQPGQCPLGDIGDGRLCLEDLRSIRSEASIISFCFMSRTLRLLMM